MKAFLCIVLLAAVALAAPEGPRDKRSPGYLGSSFLSSGFSSFGPSISSYSVGAPIISHSISSAPVIAHSSHIVSEPAVVSVKKIVEVPKVVAVKRIVTVPHVVSVPHVTSHISYAPSFSSGWW